MTISAAKRGLRVTDAIEFPRTLSEAFHIAASGRPRVVPKDIPKDVLQTPIEFDRPPILDLPGSSVPTPASPVQDR